MRMHARCPRGDACRAVCPLTSSMLHAGSGGPCSHHAISIQKAWHTVLLLHVSKNNHQPQVAQLAHVIAVQQVATPVTCGVGTIRSLLLPDSDTLGVTAEVVGLR